MSEQLMRVIVCGGRTFDDQRWVERALDELVAEIGSFVLVCGGQKKWDRNLDRWIGADYQAATWALRRGHEYMVVKAQWDRFGRRAGMLRNQQMIDEHGPSIVVAFPGGRGTANMAHRGRQAGLIVISLWSATEALPSSRLAELSTGSTPHISAADASRHT